MTSTHMNNGDRNNLTGQPSLVYKTLIHHIDEARYDIELEFQSVSGVRQSIVIPRSAATTPSLIHTKLLDAGANLSGQKDEALALIKAALNEEPARNQRHTRRGGWHGRTFVTRYWTVGEQQDLVLQPTTQGDNPVDCASGALKSWRRGLKEACAGSSYLSFGIGVAFAAPLLHLLGEDEGAVFNFHARSSRGKSTVCRASQSVFARAAKNDVATYAITPRGLEELCFERNDRMLVLDEEGRGSGGKRVTDAQKRNLAFMIPGGQGAVRSRSVSLHLPNIKWRAFGLTTGEVPLETGATRQREDGERTRHIDIALPNGRRGIFDCLDAENLNRASDYAEQIEATIRDHHGVALRPYIESLINNWEPASREAKQVIEDFLINEKVGRDPWEQRFARKFGIVLAGMVLAVHCRVAPWTEDHARESVQRAYKSALKALRATHEVGDVFVAQLTNALDHGCFPILSKGEPLPETQRETAWGFRRKVKEGRIFVVVDPARLKPLASSRPLRAALLDLFVEKGLLHQANNGKREIQIAVSGFPREGRVRWLCFYEDRLRAYPVSRQA
ncbi:DUF927 domain-containing protein [Microvirga pudoricolor]|uniref:DUF927 domain-containing protein n=1 Tax=Microvirga pudoricolor TaxID=2778729 RepID=UPI00194F4ED3|nr:DUF927 domain-containing protein [Microvirga pudoricolor]MBM6596499.1 DUF927 domain-containing protein [Microvirga pudoricolor]